MLHGKLENLIFHYKEDLDQMEPKVILMNQKTWFNLKSELYESSKLGYFTEGESKSYLSIKVFITNDVDDDEILVF